MTHPEEPAAVGTAADTSKDADDAVKKQLMDVLEADEAPPARVEVRNYFVQAC